MEQCNPDNRIKIVQINLMKSWHALNDLIMYSQQENIDIALVSEPPVTHGKLLERSRYTTIQHDQATNEHWNKTAILIFNPTIVTSYTHAFTSSNLVKIAIKFSNKTIILISVYNEPTSDIDDYLNQIDNLLDVNTNVIIAGDFNARNKIWGDVVTNIRGQKLDYFAERKDLTIINCNNTAPTFETMRGGKRIFSSVDVTMATLEILGSIKNWEVKDDLYIRSDHNIISFDLEACARSTTEHTFKLNTKETNWNLFKKEFSRKLTNSNIKTQIKDCHTAITLNELVTEVTNVAQVSLRNSTPNLNYSNNSKKIPWLAEPIKNLQRQLRRIKRRLRRTVRYNTKILEEYLKLKKELGLITDKERTESWKNYCKIQNKDTVWSNLYRLVGKSKSSKHIKLRDEQGNILDEQTGILKIKQKFFLNDDPNEDSAEQKVIRTLSKEVIFFTE